MLPFEIETISDDWALFQLIFKCPNYELISCRFFVIFDVMYSQNMFNSRSTHSIDRRLSLVVIVAGEALNIFGKSVFSSSVIEVKLANKSTETLSESLFSNVDLSKTILDSKIGSKYNSIIFRTLTWGISTWIESIKVWSRKFLSAPTIESW